MLTFCTLIRVHCIQNIICTVQSKQELRAWYSSIVNTLLSIFNGVARVFINHVIGRYFTLQNIEIFCFDLLLRYRFFVCKFMVLYLCAIYFPLFYILTSMCVCVLYYVFIIKVHIERFFVLFFCSIINVCYGNIVYCFNKLVYLHS